MKENRTARLELRLRPGDKAKIMRAAKRSGLSITGYVMQCCSGNVPREKPPDGFWYALNELSQFGERLPDWQREKLAQIILHLQETV